MRRRLAAAFIAVALLAFAAVVTWWARFPRDCRDLGSLDQYTMGSVSRVDCFPGYVVRRPEATYVLLAFSPHLEGETVSWANARQAFVSPSHGEMFDASGVLINGPAYRDMWRCPIAVEGNRLIIEHGTSAEEIVEVCMSTPSEHTYGSP